MVDYTECIFLYNREQTDYMFCIFIKYFKSVRSFISQTANCKLSYSLAYHEFILQQSSTLFKGVVTWAVASFELRAVCKGATTVCECSWYPSVPWSCSTPLNDRVELWPLLVVPVINWYSCQVFGLLYKFSWRGVLQLHGTLLYHRHSHAVVAILQTVLTPTVCIERQPPLKLDFLSEKSWNTTQV